MCIYADCGVYWKLLFSVMPTTFKLMKKQKYNKKRYQCDEETKARETDTARERGKRTTRSIMIRSLILDQQIFTILIFFIYWEYLWFILMLYDNRRC